MASPDAIACTGPRLAGGARQQGPGVRGRLRVYLGVAPGAGATCMLLREGHGRAARGADVVVASVATHGRPGTARLLAGLEVVPPAAAALLTFVRADNATQLVLGTGQHSWRSAVRPKSRIISRVIRGSAGTDVHVVTTRVPRTVRPNSVQAQSRRTAAPTPSSNERQHASTPSLRPSPRPPARRERSALPSDDQVGPLDQKPLDPFPPSGFLARRLYAGRVARQPFSKKGLASHAAGSASRGGRDERRSSRTTGRPEHGWPAAPLTSRSLP
jgi:hypothetical protein